jgi:hypothetical protein
MQQERFCAFKQETRLLSEAALLDVGVAAPRIDLREFNPLCFHVGLILESFDTYRPISLHQCGTRERKIEG